MLQTLAQNWWAEGAFGVAWAVAGRRPGARLRGLRDRLGARTA
jgi:hypothetical protein